MLMDAHARARHLHPSLLLPQEAVDRGQLPHVSGEVEKAPKPLPACATPADRGHEVVRTQSDGGQAGAEGRDGVPADQPSARLPDLRPGRRVPAAGSCGRLRRLGVALPEPKRVVFHKNIGSADFDRGDDALHPLHALRPLRSGNRRRDGARHGGSRRAFRNHDVRRQVRWTPSCRAT